MTKKALADYAGMPLKTFRIKHRRNNRRTRHQTTLLGVLALTAMLSGILLFFTNSRQQDQIHLSYCGDFGFYGKSLTLMKANTFTFSYHGCSQLWGHTSGSWSMKDSILTLNHHMVGDLLQFQYQVHGHDLLPATGEDDKFTRCDVYVDPFLRE